MKSGLPKTGCNIPMPEVQEPKRQPAVTTVVCGVKKCRFYSISGCCKKVVVLDLKGKCMATDTVEKPETETGENAAERALKYAT